MPWSAAPTEPLCDAAAAVVAARRGMETPLTAVAEAFEELAHGMEADGEELRLAPFGDTCALVSVLFSCLGIAFKKGHGIDAKFFVFEAERPGYRFSVQQRTGTYFFKGVLYGTVGFFCGLVGQGIANLIMTAKRSVKKSEDDVPVPPLLKTSALWGAFLAVSSNTRYQIINGLERLVEASPVAKRVPAVSLAFTVGVRFANNVYGGMQFVDWARWSGCQ